MDRNTPLFAGIAVLAVLVLGVGATSFPPSPSARSSSATVASGLSSSSSVDGLTLGLALNASAILQGRSVSLTIEESNSLNSQVEVNRSDSWEVQGLTDGPCGTLNFPFGFEVLSGYYSNSTGLSSSQPVQLSRPGLYSCPATLSGVTSYTFYPLGDLASIDGPCSGGLCPQSSMKYTEDLVEYWSGTSLAPLPAGVYTVVVGDEWGALVFGHFDVIAPGSGTELLPAGETFQVSSSYDCVAGHYTVPFDVQVQSALSGGFRSGVPGVSLYVSTTQQAMTTTQGHPSTWLYSTGLQTSANFTVPLESGSYVIWVEGADENCGASVVMPLEQLTTVNVTQSFSIATQ